MLGRVNRASLGYLEALGTRLLAGRLLNEADMHADGPLVAVVGAKTARLLFAGKPAVGERVVIAGDTLQIVGVVGDVVDRRLDAPLRPFAYVPMRNPTNYSIVLRSRVEPGQFANAVQREIARLDPGVAIANPRVLDKAMADSMTERRVVLMLVGAFAATALTLACIGLYGVMAYSVATRRREFSIRMALGAERGVVLRHILRDGLRLMAMGLILGTAAAVGTGRLLTAQLFQVTSFDPTVIAATGAAVAIVALLASGLPAWRAARFNPVTALRND